MSDEYRNPVPAVDIIIEVDERIVLVERKNEPLGWALPGGFIDEGESVEQAAIREAREETGLEIELQELLYVYSNPDRDPRKHTMSVVFIAKAQGTPEAADDAQSAELIDRRELPDDLCFDHRTILAHYLRYRRSGDRPDPHALLNALRNEEREES
jgi:8-oxo-dGTP diphosphatase